MIICQNSQSHRGTNPFHIHSLQFINLETILKAVKSMLNLAGSIIFKDHDLSYFRKKNCLFYHNLFCIIAVDRPPGSKLRASRGGNSCQCSSSRIISLLSKNYKTFVAITIKILLQFQSQFCDLAKRRSGREKEKSRRRRKRRFCSS